MQIRVETDAGTGDGKEDGQAGKEQKQQRAMGLGMAGEIAVHIQFERLARRLGRREEQGQEDQHEKNGAHQHHRADETEIVQGVGFQQQQAQKGGHRGEVAHQQRINLFRQGFPFVRLVFQMVHIMQRIVDGQPDNGAADSQDDDAHAALETGDDAQGEQGSGRDGNQNPQHIRPALVTEP